MESNQPAAVHGMRVKVLFWVMFALAVPSTLLLVLLFGLFVRYLSQMALHYVVIFVAFFLWMAIPAILYLIAFNLKRVIKNSKRLLIILTAFVLIQIASLLGTLLFLLTMT